MHYSVIILILCLTVHTEACTYFTSKEFMDKISHFEAASVPEKCKEEIKNYTNHDRHDAVTMIDQNGGVCGQTYFIATYHCAKRCAAQCPQLAACKMLYILCDPFEILAGEGATADAVGFSCKCFHMDQLEWCEVPQVTWDTVEAEYMRSCAGIDNATLSATSPAAEANATQAASSGTSGTTSTLSTATTTTSTATPTTSTQPETTATTAGTTRRRQSWESIGGTLAGEDRILTNVTSAKCKVTCMLWPGDGGLPVCRAYVYFLPAGSDYDDEVICLLYGRTRHTSPLDYEEKPGTPSAGPGSRFGPLGELTGTYRYAGVCDGGPGQCGVRWPRGARPHGQ